MFTIPSFPGKSLNSKSVSVNIIVRMKKKKNTFIEDNKSNQLKKELEKKASIEWAKHKLECCET